MTQKGVGRYLKFVMQKVLVSYAGTISLAAKIEKQFNTDYCDFLNYPSFKVSHFTKHELKVNIDNLLRISNRLKLRDSHRRSRHV